jgi:uncharacterized protein YukE
VSRAILVCLVAIVAVLAAGCGGDDDESSAEAWAGDFCSAASDWRSSLDDIVQQFQSPSDLSADSVQEAVDDGLAATQTFVDDVRDLGAPDTEAGQQVADIVDEMSSTIESTADDVRETLDASGDSLPDLLGSLASLSGELQQMGQQLQTSLGQLDDVEGGELRDALESNDDCAAARSGGS